MNIAVKPAKHSAAGPYLGFALQPVRLCYHLLTCGPDERVSLELLDDVTVHHIDGSFTLEQIKSALKQNPISDWAPDLWKSIANWLASDVRTKSCRYQIYVTPVHLEGWSQALTKAKTTQEVSQLVASLSTALAKLKKPPACIDYLQKFLDASPEDQFRLVSNLTIVSAHADPVDPLRSLIQTAVDPALVDTLCQAAIGMAKEKADRLIRDGHSAILDGNEFKAEFRRFVQRNNIPGYLASLTPAPDSASVMTCLDSSDHG